MKKPLFQFLKITGFLALGILLLFFAFRGIAFDELGKILRQANFWWIGLSLFFSLLAFFSRARRWTLLIEPLGYKPTFINTYHSVMVGYLANFALPRLGEVTRCVTLGKREKIPVDALIGTVIVERVIDLVMLLLIMLFLLVIWMNKFGNFFNENVFDPMKLKMVETFGGMFFFWLMLGGIIVISFILIYIFRKRLVKVKLIRGIVDFVKGILDGLKTIYKMERKWEFIFHSILIWFIYILMAWLIVFSLEATSSLTIVDGIFLMVIGGMGMAAPVTAGFGAYHWIVSRGLVFVYDLSLEQGGAYAILAHESNAIFTILLGALSYLLLMIYRQNKGVPESTA
jgi:uncharacterized protein (TIRG00374 family)